MKESEITEYLARIHYDRGFKPGMETLKRIHQLHPKYIPFENIDSYLGTVPSLAIENIFSKLVEGERGGYCYEQNLLLNSVLQHLGFNTKTHLARVLWKKEEDSKTARTHLLLTVDFQNKKYLVDCGFGAVTLTAPLLLNEEKPQQTPNGLFMISKKNDIYILWFWKEDWLPVYRFGLEDVELADLEITNWYLATNPGSGFVKNLTITKVDENARYSFSNNILNIRYNNGEKKSESVNGREQLLDVLKNVFALSETVIDPLDRRLGKE